MLYRCAPCDRACARVLLPLADRIETITYDNGKEFASHVEIATSVRPNSQPHPLWLRRMDRPPAMEHALPKGRLPGAPSSPGLSVTRTACIVWNMSDDANKQLNPHPLMTTSGLQVSARVAGERPCAFWPVQGRPCPEWRKAGLLLKAMWPDRL
jgi:hypothetical protein